MLALLILLAALATEEEPPPSPDEPIRFVVTSEPLGQGDDRTATSLEKAVRAIEPQLTPCRVDALRAGQIPARYVQLSVKMRPADGTIKRALITSSTGAETVDACVLAQISALKLDPPPKYPDLLELNMTWAPPLPEVPK